MWKFLFPDSVNARKSSFSGYFLLGTRATDFQICYEDGLKQSEVIDIGYQTFVVYYDLSQALLYLDNGIHLLYNNLYVV